MSSTSTSLPDFDAAARARVRMDLMTRPWTADDLAGVVGGHADLHHDVAVLGLGGRDVQGIGLVDERTDDGVGEAGEIFREIGHGA